METVHSRKLPVIVLILAVLVLSLPLFSQQDVVDLGLAGNCVILAKTGVTNVANSTIKGNVGVSPAALITVTGFDETLSGDGSYATSAQITEGKLYAANMAGTTPALLTEAVSNMEAAYTDASTRTGPVYEAGVGQLNNTVLEAGAGLYKWSGGVSIDTDITITGSASDVWIFQTAGVLTSGAAVQVSLGGAAQAKNIYWVTAEGASFGANSHTIGTILSMVTIAFENEASLKGIALSQTNVTLIHNDIDYCSDVPATLPVTLSSFTAEVITAGLVTLQWTTETETNMLGYNVYRNNANVLAEAAAINSGIIPAKNSSVAAHYDFTDEAIVPGSTYYYWLQSMDLDLSNTFHGPISIQVAEEGEEGSVKPQELTTKLIGAYPNPFNPTTTIRYSIKEETGVSLGIYNMLGQKVKMLVDGVQSSGDHHIEWNGTDYAGKAVGSGVYFYILKTDHYESVNKMILLK